VQVGNLEACATTYINTSARVYVTTRTPLVYPKNLEENLHKAIMTKPKPAIADGNLSLGQKAQIVAYAARQSKVNHVHIAKWASETFKTFKPVHRSTISRILQCKHEFQHLTLHEQTIKHCRLVTNFTLEIALKD